MTDITLHGTLSEILQHHADMVGRELTVIIHMNAETDIGGPEHLRIRDEAHLKELLSEAYNSPSSPMSDQDWNDIRKEVRLRAERRNGGHA